MDATNKLQVQIWSDIACPWCYVGKRRLESALQDFEHASDVRLTWRAFELDPSAPPHLDTSVPHARRLANKYGTSEAQAQIMIDRMTTLAANEGVKMDFARISPGNTFDGHRLLKFAQRQDRQGELKEALMRAYFCEGRHIGSRDVLLQAAEDAGLDADQASSVLSTGAFADEVRADEQTARELGIHGVPFFLVGRHGISGAQPAELLHKALQHAWRERDQIEESGATG